MSSSDVRGSSTRRRLRTRLRAMLAPVRRFLRALRRRILPLGTVDGGERAALFARARPESTTLVEEYRYLQEISATPKIEQDPHHESLGTIEVVIPYDGYQYLTRAAIEDIEEQARASDPAASDGSLAATVGHLVLAGAQGVTTTDSSPLTVDHGAIPLTIPILVPDREHLSADQQEASLRIRYHPPVVADHLFPLVVQVELSDPEDETDGTRGPVHEVAFSSRLRFVFVIRLFWPRRRGPVPRATVTRLGLRWPTITSLDEHFLSSEIDGSRVPLQFDPGRGHLEWRDIPIGPRRDSDHDSGGPAGSGDSSSTSAAPPAEGRRQEPEGDDEALPQSAQVEPSSTEHKALRSSSPGGVTALDRGRRIRPGNAAARTDGGEESEEPDDSEYDDVRRLDSDEIRLDVGLPGQLRTESDLHGEIEVDVDGLFSGIDARLFDACGERVRPFSDGGSWIRTRITTSFVIRLAEEFERRTMKSTHTLHFDEIVPDDRRISDIRSALRDRGFAVTMRSEDTSDRRHPTWRLEAVRVEGPDQVKLKLNVRGHHHRTRRRSETPDGHRHVTTMDTGELWITIHGEAPQNTRDLTFEINALRRSLDEWFPYVQARL